MLSATSVTPRTCLRPCAARAVTRRFRLETATAVPRPPHIASRPVANRLPSPATLLERNMSPVLHRLDVRALHARHRGLPRKGSRGLRDIGRFCRDGRALHTRAYNNPANSAADTRAVRLLAMRQRPSQQPVSRLAGVTARDFPCEGRAAAKRRRASPSSPSRSLPRSWRARPSPGNPRWCR